MAIFSDGFESGDFVGWTGQYENDGAITVQSTTKHHGTYAAQSAITSGAAVRYAIAEKNLGVTYKTLYWRAYVNFETLTGLSANDLNTFMGLYDSLYDHVGAGLYNDAGTVKWAMWYRNNGAMVITTLATPTPSINTWYCIEIKIVHATGTGEARMYIDGVEKLTATSLTNNDEDTGLCGVGWTLRSGSISEGWTVYVDCVVVADAYIGTEAAGVTVKKGSNLAAKMTEMLNSKMLFSIADRFPKLVPRRF